MKKQLDRIEAKLDEILRVETQLLKNTANINGSKGLLQTIQAWSDSTNDVCLSGRYELVYDGTQSIKPTQNIIINNLPSEPDWSMAPEWAQWWAVDLDGKAYWFDNKPRLAVDDCVWACSGEYDTYDIGRRVCDGNYPNWRNSLMPRPKAETINITAHLNTDIDGYLAGKKSFINAYVDLLLARMAKEGRFGLKPKNLSEAKVFDVYIVKQKTTADAYGIRYVIVHSITNADGDYCFCGLHITAKGKSYWAHLWDSDVNGGFVEYCRTITELEAVEFRKAMEAVYG